MVESKPTPAAELMSRYYLYRDLADLMTIVEDGCSGWPGAYWSNGLFAADAYRISQGQTTELCRPTRRWRRRLEWPERIASWCAETGALEIFDPAPGDRTKRYLGLSYDEVRWGQLDPAGFRVAVIAAAFCSATHVTAVQALLAGTPEQLAALSGPEVMALLTADFGRGGGKNIEPAVGSRGTADPKPRRM